MENVDTATTDTDSQQTGASPSEGSQGVDGKQPPQKQDQTLTPEVQELINKAIHDDRMKAGRSEAAIKKQQAEIERREAVIKEAEAKRQKQEEERELAELEAAKDKPDELPLIQRKQALAKDIRAFNAEKAQYQAIIDVLKELGVNDAESVKSQLTSVKETAYEMAVFEAATKQGVDADVLKDKADRLKIRDKESIEELASVMPKKAKIEPPDTGKTAGGGQAKTYEEKLKDRYPSMK